MKSWLLIAFTAVLSVALVAGCGGGGSGGASLSGRVIDGGTSVPLQGVRVALGTASTLTRADGTFTLSGLPLGSGLLTAQLTGYEITSVAVTIVAGANSLPDDVLMAPLTGDPPGEPPRTIEGTMTLTGESNASGVTVTLLLGGSQFDQMTTGADGKYFFWSPVGSYKVRAAMTGFVTQEQPVTVSDLTKVVTLNLTLERL